MTKQEIITEVFNLVKKLIKDGNVDTIICVGLDGDNNITVRDNKDGWFRGIRSIDRFSVEEVIDFDEDTNDYQPNTQKIEHKINKYLENPFFKQYVTPESMKIKIIKDAGEVYEEGTIMEAQELIRDYKDCLIDVTDWKEVSEKDGLDLIAEHWGIQYEVVNE